MFPVGAIVGVVFLVRLLVRAGRGQRGGRAAVLRDFHGAPRLIFWYVLVAAPVGALLPFLDYRHERDERDVGLFFVVVAGALAYVATWPLLHALARRGHYRLVYVLVQLSPLFVGSRQTGAGGMLLSALALAYRPSCTARQRDFVARRLAKDRGASAAFGAALGVWHALEARAAREAGDEDRAFELMEIAWALFGTVTYMSPAAAPLPVRRVAEELLALDAARRARWGALDLLREVPGRWQPSVVTPAMQALRAFYHEKLRGQSPLLADTRAAAKLASPVVDRLASRTPPRAPPDVAEAAVQASKTYRALMTRRPMAPRRALAMLATYDALLDPSSPFTSLPHEVRGDEALVAGVQDDVATVLAEVLTPVGVPLFAIGSPGPISARVYQHVETALFEDLARSLKRLDEQRAEGATDRPSTTALWIDASRVRTRYRLLQLSLGPAAADRVLGNMDFSYGNLGVQLTAQAPLQRPLAHAIFNVLHGECVRAGRQASIDRLAKNMRLTSRTR